MYKVLVCSRSFGKLGDDGVRLLTENNCEIISNPVGRYLKEDDFVKFLPGIEAVIVSMDEITDKALNRADKLKIISMHGVGVDNINIEAATQRGIYVANVPAIGKEAVAVADLTFGLILAIARKIPQADLMVKSGKWGRIIGLDVGGKTIGVIGIGRIGNAVIKRAKGFEMEILAFDLYKDEKLASKFGVKYVSLEKLLKESDFVTIHVPLTKDTKKLIGEKELNLMKQSSCLINVARGEIVDEKALYLALKEKRIAGAGLDVYSPEPPAKDNPLLKLDNIITTPHCAPYTPGSLRDIDYTTALNIVKALNGEKPLYAVNNLVK